jgi:hypothetical protein
MTDDLKMLAGASLKEQKEIGAMIEAAHGLDLLGTD